MRYIFFVQLKSLSVIKPFRNGKQSGAGSYQRDRFCYSIFESSCLTGTIAFTLSFVFIALTRKKKKTNVVRFDHFSPTFYSSHLLENQIIVIQSDALGKLLAVDHFQTIISTSETATRYITKIMLHVRCLQKRCTLGNKSLKVKLKK